VVDTNLPNLASSFAFYASNLMHWREVLYQEDWKSRRPKFHPGETIN
jgi:hypothetical protein